MFTTVKNTNPMVEQEKEQVAPGTTTKLTGTEILKSIKKHSGGKKFEDLLAQGYMETIKSGDKTNRLQYERLILNKVVADKTELDLSGTGTALKTIFNFGHIELPEWNQDSVIDGQIRDITPPKLSGDDEQGE